MRCLVLGAGEIGSAACHYLRKSEPDIELTVGDLSQDAIDGVVACDGKILSAGSIDVLDTKAVVAALRDQDILVNCVGPFYRFGMPVLEAAIAAGVNYFDVCDDWEALENMLSLDAKAREAGILAVLGIGASPGISNLLASYAMHQAPATNGLITGWTLPDRPGNPEGAANDHWLQQCTGTIKIFEDGRFTEKRPLEEIGLALPGFEPRIVQTCGHPEAITLPRYFDLRDCVNVMSLPKGLALTIKRAAVEVDNNGLSMREAALTIFPSHQANIQPPWPEYPPLWALARSEKEEVAVYLDELGEMDDVPEATAAPLVAAIQSVGALEGKSGVFAPEGIIDPLRFFENLHALTGSSRAPTVNRSPSNRNQAVLTKDFSQRREAARLRKLSKDRTVLS
jgi:hypothetical protein